MQQGGGWRMGPGLDWGGISSVGENLKILPEDVSIILFIPSPYPGQ